MTQGHFLLESESTQIMAKKKDEGQKQEKSKQRRRKHGEGSITERKDGRFQVSISLEDGSRKTIYRKNYKDAETALQKARNELNEGTLVTGPQQKLKEYLEYWLEDVHKAKIRVSTYESYRIILNNHLIPALGNITIQKLTSQHLQSLYAKKRNEGLSQGRIRTIHAVIHRALEHAMRITPPLISRNVSESVDLPGQGKHEMHPLTPEQAQQLLGAAQEHDLLALLTLALTTGMRKGELLGLQWEDINWTQSTLQIHRTASYITGRGIVVGEPKTKGSKRQIALPQVAIDVLKQHRTTQLENRLKAGSSWIDQNLVFCDDKGDYIVSVTLNVHFSKLLKDIGLPHMRFHDLRHSAATLLLSMGVNVKIVQELLGHSNVSMTLNVYSHVLPSMQKEAMNKMDILFRKQGHDKKNDQEAR